MVYFTPWSVPPEQTWEDQGGTPGSIPEQDLMSGPDLTNQIVGVLTRFCEEPVVIMGDIESMFHQVMVPREYRSLLRFLWWEDHDISGTEKDFEMFVHVFGGTSSPSCCNYALK